MDLNVSLHRLTDEDIYRAMNVNSGDQVTDNSAEKEQPENEQSDSEDDHESNFEGISSDDEIDSEDEMTTEMLPTVYIGKDKTEWSREPLPLLPQKVYRRNTVYNKVNLSSGQHIELEMDSFLSIFDAKIVDVIVKFTNIQASKSQTNWKPVDEVEIRAFIGLLIIAGVDRSSKKNYEEIYDSLHGMPIFKATMSKHRFKHIMQFMRFDDKNTRSVRRQKDKLAPIRDVFDLIIKNLIRLYSPGSNLTLDEQLIPFHGRCALCI